MQLVRGGSCSSSQIARIQIQGFRRVCRDVIISPPYLIMLYLVYLRRPSSPGQNSALLVFCPTLAMLLVFVDDVVVVAVSYNVEDTRVLQAVCATCPMAGCSSLYGSE